MQQRPDPCFAHPSEAEFARLLDFYCIQWRYEPRSFPLRRHPNGEISQAFTPDFYLPQLNVYVELTTMRQGNIAPKHRKLRLMAAEYPDIRVRLLYRRDIAHLRAAAEPVPSEIGHPADAAIERVVLDQGAVTSRVSDLAEEISRDYAGSSIVLVGVLKGCAFFLADLARQLTCPIAIDYLSLVRFSSRSGHASTVRFIRDAEVDLRGRHVLIVKDVVNTGLSLDYLLKRLKGQRPASVNICALLVKQQKQVCDLPVRYVGFRVDNDFLVGYGLDYREQYRNLPYIASLAVAD